MFVRKAKTRGRQCAVALATCLGFCAGEAAANREALPAAYFSLASYQANADPLAKPSANKSTEARDKTTARSRTDLYRARNFTVLNYERELKLRNEAVIVRMKSPGTRNSLVSLEFKF